jgi:hypothetical protein
LAQFPQAFPLPDQRLAPDFGVSYGTLILRNDAMQGNCRPPLCFRKQSVAADLKWHDEIIVASFS